MSNANLQELLKNNSYPGRGIVIGRSECGKFAVTAYFIMGRSANSRNRIFVDHDGGIRTQAHDPAKLEDPSLIIYAPVRVHLGHTIVTNGDQTDTIYDTMLSGGKFEDALRKRTFEPDAPNYTPRISGKIDPKGEYVLSILKSADGDPSSTRRYFYEYENPIAGQGHFIHTYRCDGDPIPSFEGEPVQVGVSGDIDSFAQGIWQSLNEENKVSLFVRYIELKSGKTDSRIINKNQ